MALMLLYSCRSLAFVATSKGATTRCAFASFAATTADDDMIIEEEAEDALLIAVPNSIPYPKSLSPSSIMEFQKCPQSFLFQYLWKMRQGTSPILAKGTMCHSALEQVFDLDPKERTLQNLQNLFRSTWQQKRQTAEYRVLFEGKNENEDWNVEEEREWGLAGLQLLENYVELEDPRLVLRPNPVKRETWVRADLAVDPDDDGGGEKFLVRGIVDRLDMIKLDDGVCMRLVDYKSGKAPNLKYSASMNEKIAEESFFQLKIYALLLREQSKNKSSGGGMDLRILRLLHLTSVDGPAKFLDYDLGATDEERNALLDGIHENLADTWTQIRALVDTQDPLEFQGCDRSFCYCHKCRPNFLKGSVWEP